MTEKGKVYVDRLPGRFEGKQWPTAGDAVRFNVCSSSNQKIDGHELKQLSPFFLGPIQLHLPAMDMGGEDSPVATNIENFWQASKVWKGETRREVPSNVASLIPEHGTPGYWTKMWNAANFTPRDFIPNSEWFSRRAKYWADPVPHRRIKRGTGENNDNPMYCWWLGEAMPYVEARCKMYIPMYADLASKTPAFKALKKLVEDGNDVLLIGYDGYEVEKPLIEYLRDPSVRFGHELVLAAMLRGEEPWKELYPDTERVWDVPEELVPDTTNKKKKKEPPAKKRKTIVNYFGK